MKRIWFCVLSLTSFLMFSYVTAGYVTTDNVAVGPYDKGTMTYVIGDSKFDLAFRVTMPEVFGTKNIVLLNNDNREDRSFFIRHTFDIGLHYWYGKNNFDHEIIQVFMNMRDRGVWGNPESIASTTENTIKAYEVRFGDHKHGIPRHIWWIRELWLDLDISNVFNFPLTNKHFITIGSFSFVLGRGIALGDAFSVTPDPILGFSIYDTVDQYAFGARLYGDIVPSTLGYDLYGAFLRNKADSFANTATKIRGQEFGRKFDQFRGFGVINFVVAGKLRWTPVEKGERSGVYVEPYWLYSNDPEQKVEFLGDATSKLGTLGCMGDFLWGDIEFGFDTAFNLGGQKVKGIDRNVIVQENVGGFLSIVNTAVDLIVNPGQPNEATRKLPYRLTVVDAQGEQKDVQSVVNKALEAESYNGTVLLDNVTLDDFLVTGQTQPVPVKIVNGKDRFRDPYFNKFEGSMFIADLGYWLYKRDFKIAGAFGFATGDANPNRDQCHPKDSLVDGDFKGFIGIQEYYSGTQVRSAFFLSGVGKVPRLLNLPSQRVNDRFASTVQRFTNIVFVGGSTWYLPQDSPCKINVNPNLLLYWQEFATRRFDLKPEERQGRDRASTFLGTEANIFFDMEPLVGLRFFFKTAIFFPGKHFTEVKGRVAINKEQREFLDRKDRTGVVKDREPVLGDDIAFGTNFGLEYRF